jgi:hypothetical protein
VRHQKGRKRESGREGRKEEWKISKEPVHVIIMGIWTQRAAGLHRQQGERRQSVEETGR